MALRTQMLVDLDYDIILGVCTTLPQQNGYEHLQIV